LNGYKLGGFASAGDALVHQSIHRDQVHFLWIDSFLQFLVSFSQSGFRILFQTIFPFGKRKENLENQT
jgi:hypothetical protein